MAIHILVARKKLQTLKEWQYVIKTILNTQNYFTSIHDNDNANQGEILNDYIIPPRDKETANRHGGRHFQI